MIQNISHNEHLEVKNIVELINSKNPNTLNWSQSSIGEALEHSSGVGYFEKKSLVGMVLFKKISENLREILVLGTHPEFQHKGYMSKLLTYLQTEYIGTEWWLEVHEKNTPAQNLYIKMGFQKVGYRKNYYPDNGGAVLFSYQVKPLQRL